MELKNIKIIGGVGVLLAILSVIPGLGIFAGIAGLVFVFIAISELSKLTKNKKIYDNFLVSFILQIVLATVGGLALIGMTVRRIFMGSMLYYGYIIPNRRFPNFNFGVKRHPFGLFEGPFSNFGLRENLGIGIIIVSVVFGLILYGILVARSYYLKKSYEEISKETQVGYFRTAGNLMFIGSILSIILVGLLVYFIGYIFEVVAFFSLKDNLEVSTQESPPPLL
ncbi:MAG: DUF996 domain-containing protein [Caldisericum exile]|uniref:DUF996 domain-containing protein n=1 Tax=Caldisericum exile TaxID=693075 RepID=UPI003C796364